MASSQEPKVAPWVLSFKEFLRPCHDYAANVHTSKVTEDFQRFLNEQIELYVANDGMHPANVQMFDVHKTQCLVGMDQAKDLFVSMLLAYYSPTHPEKEPPSSGYPCSPPSSDRVPATERIPTCTSTQTWVAFASTFINPDYAMVGCVNVRKIDYEFSQFAIGMLTENITDGGHAPTNGYLFNTHKGQFLRTFVETKNHFVKMVLAYNGSD